MPGTFTKRRDTATPGSIPDRLQMFPREVRFYREVAPVVGVRVPACYRAEEHEGATLLELEDLSSWRQGADPAKAAEMLAGLHQRWEGMALNRWPWLGKADVSDLVEQVFSQTWVSERVRSELTDAVRDFGDGMVGHVAEADRRAAASGVCTLVHGDASARNMRTSPAGEIALLDWEDFGSEPGICDLAWFLVSSVTPGDWDRTIAGYGDTGALGEALPAAVVQGLLSLVSEEVGSADALERMRSLDEATRRV